MAARAGVGIDFLMRVLNQSLAVTGDQCVEKLLIEGDIDFSVFRFARPVRQAAGGDDGDALGGSF